MPFDVRLSTAEEMDTQNKGLAMTIQIPESGCPSNQKQLWRHGGPDRSISDGLELCPQDILVYPEGIKCTTINGHHALLSRLDK